MTTHLRDEQIHDALDGRLSEPLLGELRNHVRSCGACRARWQALEALKSSLRELAAPKLPPALAQALSATLDTEDRRRRSAMRGRRWLLLAAGVAGLAALAGWMARFATPPHETRPDSLPVLMARDFQALRSGHEQLSVRTSNPVELERRLAASGLGFPTRVFDLAMMKQHLLGGSAGTLGGRPAALVAYRGEDGTLLVCRMLNGTLAELPAPQRRRDHEGIAFQIYDVDGLTLVFWQEGVVVCALVGDGPPEAVVELALAKAMKAVA
jgi:anti-sigma factor RsiW